MRDKGVTQNVSFSRHNLDLYDYVQTRASNKKTDISSVIMECIREHKDSHQVTTRELITALMEKIDNLSLVGIPVEQSKQVKEEVKEALGYDIGDNLFG